MWTDRQSTFPCVHARLSPSLQHRSVRAHKGLHIPASRVESSSGNQSRLGEEGKAGHHTREILGNGEAGLCVSAEEQEGGEVQGSHQCDQRTHTSTPVLTPTCAHADSYTLQTCAHTQTCAYVPDLCTYLKPMYTLQICAHT